MHLWHNHASVTVVTPPGKEPLTVADVKNHARIDTDADNLLISGYITAARVLLERAWLRKQIITATLQYTLDQFPAGSDADRGVGGQVLTLPRPPLQSVTAVQYLNLSNVLTTWDTSNYIVDVLSSPGRIALGYAKYYPPDVLPVANAVRITYVAGYGADPTDVPQTIRLAMMQLVAHWYDQREPLATAGSTDLLPFHVQTLLTAEMTGTYP